MSSTHESARHDRLSSLFLQACDLAGDKREAFLREECADDPQLAEEILELLPYDDQHALVDQPLVRVEDSGLFESHAAASANAPQRIGQYEILGVLGQGGMGTVYEARQQNPDRIVALKVIQCGLASPATVRAKEPSARPRRWRTCVERPIRNRTTDKRGAFHRTTERCCRAKRDVRSSDTSSCNPRHAP